MNEATAQALAAINRDFYRDHAAEFSATRSAPWPGWEPLLPALRATPGGGAVHVLDVGCGNGRFARYLAEALAPRAIAICGVDASEPLLDAARCAGPPGSRWETCDVVTAPDALPPGPFDLVALFAVIHGVPSRERRLALLSACAARVAPGGRLALTTWRRGERERAVDWNSYSSRSGMPIDCSQLEPGDHLIPWGDGKPSGAQRGKSRAASRRRAKTIGRAGRRSDELEVVRYFHSFDESELATWTAGLPLVLDQRYRADGRTGDQNEYFVFRAR